MKGAENGVYFVRILQYLKITREISVVLGNMIPETDGCDVRLGILNVTLNKYIYYTTSKTNFLYIYYMTFKNEFGNLYERRT